MPNTILIVDDDPVQRRLLEAMLRRFGYDAARGGEWAKQALSRLRGCGRRAHRPRHPRLVMPDLDGMGVLRRMRESGIETPAIVQTAHGSIDAVVTAMRGGRSRLRRQAGRRGAPAGLDQERAAGRRARGRGPQSAPPRFGHAQLPRPRHRAAPT